MSKITYSAIFNDTDLTSVNGLTVLKTNPYRPAKRKVDISDLVRTNKSKINSAFYNEKTVSVTVEITRNTRALMETSLDSLMAILQPIDKPLVLNQSGGQRKYYCTYEDYVVNEDAEGGSFIELELVFKCSDRFGYDINPTQLLAFTGFTSNNRSDQLTFSGSALWQVPIITVTFSSVTSATTKTVTIGNASTGQAIVVTRTWVAGDVIIVDAFNRSVTVNGVETAFTGAIPEFNKGSGYWYYVDTFSARTMTGQITCAPRYV